jgi:hypothetical protein
MISPIQKTNPWPDDNYPRSLRYALHAVSVELYGYSFPSHMQPQLQASRDVLWDNALSLATKIDLQDDTSLLAHALCLLLLSHTWCMVQQSAALALRWCSLAGVLLEDVQTSFGNSLSPLAELTERYVRPCNTRNLLGMGQVGLRSCNRATIALQLHQR